MAMWVIAEELVIIAVTSEIVAALVTIAAMSEIAVASVTVEEPV